MPLVLATGRRRVGQVIVHGTRVCVEAAGSLGTVSVHEKFNLVTLGPAGGQPMLFAHGFGCDQHMWRYLTRAFDHDYRVVLFDYVGAGGSDISAYDPARYCSLDAYAADVLEICGELSLANVIFVGHSVSSMIGVLAAIADPSRFSKLIMVGPSPRYIDDDQYHGGFAEADIDELLDSLESNYLGWSATMAPAIIGNPDRPELGAELTASFCRTDPAIAQQFAEVTFRSDNRDDLRRVEIPTLILQCDDDIIAPISVGEYVHKAVSNSTLVVLKATGHCPHLSAPEQTIEAIEAFLRV